MKYDIRVDLDAYRHELERWAWAGLTSNIDPERDSPGLEDPTNVMVGKLLRVATEALRALREADEGRAKDLARALEGLKQRNANQGRLFA